MEESKITEYADIAIINGTIYTADECDTIKQAVAIKDGIITHIGCNEEIECQIGHKTRLIDLEGNSMIPGIVDSHMHPAISAATYAFEITLQNETSEEGYLKVIKEFVESNPNQNAYFGAGFMRSVFDEIGPRKEKLDGICKEKPIILMSVDGHSKWINSKAMELSGISSETNNPKGGVIQKDPETGEPSGLLQEAAMNLVSDLNPKYTREEYKEAILMIQKWFNQEGIVSIYDAMINLDEEEQYMAYQELAQSGELNLRVRGAWLLTPDMNEEELLKAIEKGMNLSKTFTTPYFQVNSFKFFSDQVLEEKTAYMKEPYVNSGEWRGIKVWDEDLLEKIFIEIDKRGFQLHIHQIGDEAATYVLNALEKVEKANGKRDSRHTMVHVQFLSKEDIKRMADLNIMAVVAPYWMGMDDYYWELYLPYVGENRVNNMYPYKSLIEAGVLTATHSDFIVTEPDIGSLFYGAISRTMPEKKAADWCKEKGIQRTTDYSCPTTDFMIGPLKPQSERVSLKEVIKSSTFNGAYTNFIEKEIGSIEVGKAATAVIFGENIFELDLEEISNIKPAMTINDGKIVF